MTTLLISGSRQCNLDMQASADHLVWATVNYDEHYPSLFGAEIVAGDAVGIDATVVRCCELYGCVYHWYGVTPRPRAWAAGKLDTYTDVWKQPYNGDAYLFRDRYMVDLADMVIAIWNGQSRGTKYTYDYAVKQGKRARLLTFVASDGGAK